MSVAATLVTSFLVVYVLTPKAARLFRERSLTSPDVHKPLKPQIPCLGGLIILGGLMAGFLLGSIVGGIERGDAAMFVLTILLLGVVGLIDYLLDLGHRMKVVLCFFAGLPLALMFNGDSVLYTPFGRLEFGVLYCVIIPFVVTAAANLTNMFAGFNGLESGLGSLIAGTMLLSALITHELESAIMMAALLGSLIAFLLYNWYPSKIFLSDVGTLSIGAVIAVAVVTGRMKLAFVFCLLPFFIDFLMKASIKFEGRIKHGDAKLNPDGTLNPPPYPALPHIILKYKRLDEPKLVRTMLLFQAVFCAIALTHVIMQHM